MAWTRQAIFSPSLPYVRLYEHNFIFNLFLIRMDNSSVVKPSCNATKRVSRFQNFDFYCNF